MSNLVISESWYRLTINKHARTNKSTVIHLVLDFYYPARGFAEARAVQKSSGKNAQKIDLNRGAQKNQTQNLSNYYQTLYIMSGE